MGTMAAPAMAKPPLLIVDDDEELRTQMKWALGDDYEVALAGDRAEALQKLREVRPALVTLDGGTHAIASAAATTKGPNQTSTGCGPSIP